MSECVMCDLRRGAAVTVPYDICSGCAATTRASEYLRTCAEATRAEVLGLKGNVDETKNAIERITVDFEGGWRLCIRTTDWYWNAYVQGLNTRHHLIASTNTSHGVFCGQRRTFTDCIELERVRARCQALVERMKGLR